MTQPADAESTSDLTNQLATTRSVVAVGLLFAVNGLMIGGYGGALPSIRERLTIDAPSPWWAQCSSAWAPARWTSR